MRDQTKKKLTFLGILTFIVLQLWLSERSRRSHFDELRAAGREILSRTGAGAMPSDQLVNINWASLRRESASNGPSAAIQGLNQKRVSVEGFMVNLDGDRDNVSEFLLVPSPLTCIHVPTPPPDQIIFIQMAKDAKAHSMGSAIKVEGIFHVSNQPFKTRDAAAYSLEADSVKAAK